MELNKHKMLKLPLQLPKKEYNIKKNIKKIEMN